MGFSHDEVVVVAVLAGFGVLLLAIIAWRIGQSIRARSAELPPVQQLAYHRERELARMSRLSSTVSSKMSLVSPDDDHDSFSSRPLSSASIATSRRSRGPPHRSQVQIVLPRPLYKQKSLNDHRLSMVDSWAPLPSRSSAPRHSASRRASLSSLPPVPPIPMIYTLDNTQHSDRGRSSLTASDPARQRRSRSATQARSQKSLQQGAGIY